MNARRAAILLILLANILPATRTAADRLRPVKISNFEIAQPRAVSEVDHMIPSKLEIALGVARGDDGFIVVSLRRTNLVSSLYLTKLADDDSSSWSETGIRLASDVGPPWVTLPALARGDGRTLVTWFDDDQLHARVVLDDGTLMDEVLLGNPFPFARETPPQIVWNGAQFILADQALLEPFSTLLFLDAEGGLSSSRSGPDGLPVASAVVGQNALMAFIGHCAGAYCLAPLTLASISPDGTSSEPIAAGEIVYRQPDQLVNIVPDNGGWLVLTVEESGATSLHRRYVSTDLTMTDAGSTEIPSGTSIRTASLEGQSVLFDRYQATIGVRPIRSSEDIGDAVTRFPTLGEETFLASCGESCLVTHSEWLARRVSAALVPDESDVPIAMIAPPQSEPTVAVGGGRALVTWMETTDGEGSTLPTRIKARLVALDGSTLGPVLDLGTGHSQNVAAGSAFLVSWFNQSPANLVFRRVSFDGEILGASPVPITATTPWFTKPAIGSDGSNFLVAWLGWESGVLGTTISADGAVTAFDGIVLDSRRTDQASAPAMEWNGTEWLVAWSAFLRDDCFSKYCVPVHRIEGVRVTANGSPVETIVIGSGSGNESDASIGAATGSWFAAWNDAGGMLALARVDRFGTVWPDESEVATRCSDPAVVAGGVWQGVDCTVSSGGLNDVAFLPLHAGSGLRTGSPITVSDSEDEEGQVDGAATGRAMLSVFVREDGSPEVGGSQRVYVSSGKAR